MREIETFYRGEKLGSQARSLLAHTYNSLRVLLDLSDRGCVFVPIRSMQYMAVIDKEEVIFVDAMSARRSIEFSWQVFCPQLRTSLSEPVGYTLIYYDRKALETMKQAQLEFDKSVQRLYLKSKQECGVQSADVLEFPKH